MELQYLGDSSCVQAAGYENGELTIQFQDGKIVTYMGVSPLVWGTFIRVTSKGYWFNMNIRNNYPFYNGASNNMSNSAEKFMNNLFEEASEDIPLIE